MPGAEVSLSLKSKRTLSALTLPACTRRSSSAYIHLKKFDGRARLSTRLTRIAINAALMKIRKNRVSRKVEVEDAGDGIIKLFFESFRIVHQRNESRLELKKQIPASLFKGV